MIMPTGLTLTTSKNAKSALSRRPSLRPRSPPRNLMTTPNSGGQNIRFERRSSLLLPPTNLNLSDNSYEPNSLRLIGLTNSDTSDFTSIAQTRYGSASLPKLNVENEVYNSRFQ